MRSHSEHRPAIDTGARAVAWAAQTFAELPVLYVHGNHEGYGHKLDQLQQEIQAACAAAGNVHFLNCDEHIIGEVRLFDPHFIVELGVPA